MNAQHGSLSSGLFRGLVSKLALAALGLVLCAPQAHAGGFENARFGGQRGHAATPTPLAVYYNPAALSATRHIHIAVDGVLALHGQSYKRTETNTPEPEDAQGANLGSTKSLDVLGAPALAASVRLGNFALGAGVFVPFGGFVHWQGNDDFKGNQTYVGAQDGVARWHAIDASTLFLYMSAGASYVIKPLRLSFGVGVNAIYGSANMTRAQSAARDDNVATEGRSEIDVNGWMASYSVGAMWELWAEKLWLGVSYQAPPGMYGGMTLEGTVRTRLGGTTTDQKADLHQKFADIVRWALRFKPTKSFELRLFGDYQRWSVLKTQCVAVHGKPCHVEPDGSGSATELLANQPMNFKDTFGVNLGGSIFFTSMVEVFAGLGYDSNAIPASTLSPLVLDGDDISITLGTRLSLADRIGLLLSLTHTQWLPRTVNSKLDEPLPPTRLPSASGDYKQWVTAMNVLFEVGF
jgi:long-chain fatty acid transport protein